MTRRWIARAAPLVCALVPVLATARAAAAQDRPAKASVSIALCETRRNGTITGTSASAGGALAVGESATRYVFANAAGNRLGQISVGSPDTIGASTGGVMGGLSGGIAGPPPTPSRPVMDHLWQADTKVISVDVDTVTFELDWKRSDLKDGALQFVRGDHRTITLRQGERHLLDFVPLGPEAPEANLFVEMRAEPVEDAAVRNVILGYDLWLVHQTPDGTKATRHLVLTGRQGEKVNFNFSPVPLAIDAATTGPDSPFRLYVSGTITGRVSSDGSIQIALNSARRNGTPEGVFGFDGGTKTFSAKPDETVSVAIPPYYGRSGWTANSGFTLATPKPGVSLVDGRIRIDLSTFFDGATTSILVTAHRER